MYEIKYAGPFRNYLKSHIELKQAVGYKYVTEAGHLKRFDQFTLEKYPNAPALPKRSSWTGAANNPMKRKQTNVPGHPYFASFQNIWMGWA